ncbi:PLASMODESMATA CALLOSE-BINDING PROTEIN 2-like [Iris pallida]|uniref:PLASMODESMATA CALLOSE-BINDING PROTEIN 2-like n=1 Tax=Iris pallida TaxID=29817 RepID=A0AAX6E5V8_IRIPA|nr:PLASMODESMATA CALLOSE-BINDING PROTEIN 2-like [Iris pallida]KAJ6799438.1 PLASMODESMATA CALLOSE-BINDING PROTEIN 2-like [Iris pallida]KAJ6823712.1 PLASMODESMATA CALLOSE-BINDING PROTEIN 2-like [Iris pallida]
MAALVCCLVVMLAIVGVSDGAWCVCRSDVGDSSLQKALDYACGAGADCTPVAQGGSCYNPNSVRAHCSYAVNSYYQRKGQNQQACDFSGAATLTNSDPSASTCTYPASSSGAGTSTSTTPSTSTNSSGSSTTPGSTTPNTLTPSTGTGGGGGGVLGGLGPSGNSITDSSDKGLFPSAGMAALLSLMITGVVMLRG